MFEDYKTKDSVVIVYTGEGKGKTSAAIGLVARALGSDWKVSFIQFIKHWEVGEHRFFARIANEFGENLDFYKGGKGFYRAGDMSAKNVSEQEHKQAAQDTLKYALRIVSSGKYNLVVCDEINNALHDGLLSIVDVKKLFKARNKKTSLCLTGRNFPSQLNSQVDILTDMNKVRHHYDDKFLANKGIDF